MQRSLNKADHCRCLNDSQGKKSNSRRRQSLKFWLLSPMQNQVLRAQKMFCNSRVAITNTGQQNHVLNCTAACVVLTAREREECINAPDVRWDCAWCLVTWNITLKWICNGFHLWILCVMIKQWSKVLQTFCSNQNYGSNQPFTPNFIQCMRFTGLNLL
jgi:hypothetical protein